MILWIKRLNRWRYRHHQRHPNHAPARSVLGITRIEIQGDTVSTVTLAATVPTTRKSGKSLSVDEILRIDLSRNGAVMDSVVPTGPTIQFVDSSPGTGNDTYNVETFTKDGFVSDPSNDAIVSIAGADPAVAISDLTATVS